jgi:pantothenate synthetase
MIHLVRGIHSAFALFFMSSRNAYLSPDERRAALAPWSSETERGTRPF